MNAKQVRENEARPRGRQVSAPASAEWPEKREIEMEKNEYVNLRKSMLNDLGKRAARSWPSLVSTYNETKWERQLFEMASAVNRLADAEIARAQVDRLIGIDS